MESGAISGDISLVRVTSSCEGAADAVNLISRQIGSVSEHKELFMGSFLVPQHLPKLLPSAPNSSNQHFHISDVDIGIEEVDKSSG